MNLSKRRAPAEPTPAEEPYDATSKGRPTPKRRDAVGPRGPVSAPKSRKEAYARQKQQAKAQKVARRTPAAQLTVAQRRELMKAGDPSVLPKRDQGETKKLARDWVDSHRMASNYLLILFPLIVIGYKIPALQFLVLLVFLVLLLEWFLTGRRIRKLALARFGTAQSSALQIGFYAGSRAYLPRRWRLPKPQVGLGDQI